MSSQPKKKNNHFVPRSYLQRFCSGSDRQIALFNLKSGRTVEAAPIKSQCSRDYFYTKNPIFEQNFSKIEGEQKRLLSDIIASQSVPAHGSSDRVLLSRGVMFQAGRTATTVANADYVTNQFGKALLRHHLTKDPSRPWFVKGRMMHDVVIIGGGHNGLVCDPWLVSGAASGGS